MFFLDPERIKQKMAFFDNWRVQYAQVGAYNNDVEKRIQGLEKKYIEGSEEMKTQIFEQYQREASTSMMSSNVFISALWKKSCQLYPELNEVDDQNVINEILNCSTKEEQDEILSSFKQTKMNVKK